MAFDRDRLPDPASKTISCKSCKSCPGSRNGTKASGDGAAVERWLAVLRSSKAELVELLRRQAEPAPAALPRLTPEQRDALTARLVAAPGYREAMSAAELDTFASRQRLFQDRGLTAELAEARADKLVLRDREGDDRRLCLECRHLQGAGRWRCGNWHRAGVARDGLARDLVLMLQRCDGYHPAMQALNQPPQPQPLERPHA